MSASDPMAESPWRPLATAPKDGSWIMVGRRSSHGDRHDIVHWVPRGILGRGQDVWANHCGLESADKGCGTGVWGHPLEIGFDAWMPIPLIPESAGQ